MNFLFLFVLHDKNGSFLPNRRVILRSQRMRSAWQHPILCFGFWRPSNWLLGDWSVFINLMFPPCRRSYCQTFLGWSLHGRRLLSRSPRREKYQTKFLELFIFIMSIQIRKIANSWLVDVTGILGQSSDIWTLKTLKHIRIFDVCHNK